MIPVMCNCANNRFGQCYGNVNTAVINRVMQVVDQDGNYTTPSGSNAINEHLERVSASACAGYIAAGSTPFAGVPQGGVKIDQEGNHTNA